MSTPSNPSLDELAAQPIDGQDLAALDRIAALFDRLDPVPEGLVDRIRFSITLDALHAEIAELQRDNDLVGVRSIGAADTQTVTFTSASLTVMITISPSGADRVRIDGWVAPGGGVQVQLRLAADTAAAGADGAAAETRSTTGDPDGRFVFTDVPRGFAQFVVRQPSGVDRPPVVTPSIEL
jgi:hypothetical protein